MGTYFAAPWLAAGFTTILFVSVSAPLRAQSAFAAPGLKDAVEAAWRRQPQAVARDARAEEFAARKSAAEALLPAPPAVSMEHTTDALNRNDGRRAFNGEIALPLWLPGQKDRAQAVVAADLNAYEANVDTARLRLAGEVRESYWQARADAAEQSLAQAALDALVSLEADVKRRVTAGELARVDANRAEGETQLQRLALAEAQGRAHRSEQVFRALTGLPRLPDSAEAMLTNRPDRAAHPAIGFVARQVDAAQARLRQASGDTRDAPELGVGTTRERANFIAPWDQTLILRLRVPLGTENRNRPRIAAASAELAEAQAARNLIAAQIDSEAAAAGREADLAASALPLAERRVALARDTRALLARGFAAGEFDFTTRLRAERELRDAELGRARARLAAGRANSRLKQSLGVMP